MMFERFTTDARDVVVRAQVVARTTNSRTIDTRHVVLAMLSDPVATSVRAAGGDTAAIDDAICSDLTGNDLDKDALASLGIDLDAITTRAEETFGRGALDRSRKSPKHLPFTKDAKKALELALREAIRLGERGIDSRHLLLGVLRADCPGRQAVAEHVDIDDLRGDLERTAAA